MRWIILSFLAIALGIPLGAVLAWAVILSVNSPAASVDTYWVFGPDGKLMQAPPPAESSGFWDFLFLPGMPCHFEIDAETQKLLDKYLEPAQ